MVQTHIFTEAQARARGISIDTLIAPYLLDKYRVVERTRDYVKIQRTVSLRDIRY